MTNKKTQKTQKDFFNDIIALAEANDCKDIADFARDRIRKLDSKNSKASKKRIAEVAENEALVLEAHAVKGVPLTSRNLLRQAR